MNMMSLSKKSTSPFLETIKLEDGYFFALSYHQKRIDRTRSHFYRDASFLSLPQALMRLDNIPQKGLYRVRVIYGETISEIEFVPYEMRPVNSLKLIEAATLDYHYKYEKRPVINTLFQQKRPCDDILITRNGFLTDTSIANIALFDGEQWYTPKEPLLEGTKRAALLHHGLLIPREIHRDQVAQFSKIRLFNAMIDFGEIEFSTKNILG